MADYSPRRRTLGGLTMWLAVLGIIVAQLVLFLGFQYINNESHTADAETIPLVSVAEQVIRTLPDEMQEPTPEPLPEPPPPTPLPPPPTPPPTPVPTPAPPALRPAQALQRSDAEDDLLRRLNELQTERAPSPQRALPTRTPNPDTTPAFELRAAVVTPVPARPTTTPPPPQQIKIVDVEQKRFPASQATDEERLLNITLTLAPNATTVRGNDITLRIVFYDELDGSGRTIPSRVQSSYEPIRLQDRIWQQHANYLISTTYRVPKGFRETQRQRTGEQGRYFGYRIEVFHKGFKQEEYAQPRSLLGRTD